MDENARYEAKRRLLLERYEAMGKMNEKLQCRIYHIRKQLRYMRSLKRIIIHKLLMYGDRFMELSLEIPDMEPGANIEDRIIDCVAEVPKQPPTPAVAAPPAQPHQTAHAAAPPLKRRKPPSGPKPSASSSFAIRANLEEIVNSVILDSSKQAIFTPPPLTAELVDESPKNVLELSDAKQEIVTDVIMN